MLKSETFEEVKAIFSKYLEAHNHRKTPERFAILKEIYSRDDHFDVDQLYVELKNKNFHISRATVYNTLDLLLECDLVIKHLFGKNTALYEKAFGYRQHDHLLCNHCDKVLEFCDPRIQQIQNVIGDLLKFDIERHALTLYGDPKVNEKNVCLSCQKKVKGTARKNR